MKPRVIVFVSGGVIQDMTIPPGIVVEVHDYDVEGIDDQECDVRTDDDGNRFVHTEWEGE